MTSVQVNGLPCRVTGMSMFQSQVKPEWEDPVNKNGGQFQINFKSNLPFLQTIWDKLVFSIVTGEFDGADMISGIRLLDKSAFGRESMFRIEIWTKFNSENQMMVQELQTHLETEYIQLMINDDGTKPLKRVEETNPAFWLEAFKNLSGDNNNNQRAAGGNRGPPPPQQ